MAKSTKNVEKIKELANKYRDGLNSQERTRYESKLKLIGGEDPYEMVPSVWSEDVCLLPTVTYPDIVNYLVFSPSPYTSDDLKSFKGLDAYNQFVCGWVRDKTSRIMNDKYLVKAKVLHSQRMSEKPLQPWVIADKEGCILGAHCTCMAGLGEACTHVAALLFSIEATVKLRDSKTVTEEKSYWLLPGSVKGVTYKQCREIDFTSAKTMKKKMDTMLDRNCSSVLSTPSHNIKKIIPEPTEEELSTFFKSLHASESKPAILSLISPYAEEFVPKPVTEEFPVVLTELRNESCVYMNYNELFKKCQDIKISVTEEQARSVEIATREQAHSKLWYRFRAGRITASKMKNACCTDPTLPAQSLIKSICYPENYRFSSKATQWGCQHEKYACDIFLDKLKPLHDNIKIEKVGFFINPDVPYIGASPDGIITCDCCGMSVVEIKCPFCDKDATLHEKSDKNFYLTKERDGKLKLDNKHSYYYQVQTQLGVCRLESAYFVVWTEKDLHMEQIMLNLEMWQEICKKSKHIFDTAILPELVGKFYSRLPNSNPLTDVLRNASSKLNSDTSVANDGELTWCFCDQVESGKMICCENQNCKLQWFHYLCLGINCAPRGKWFCPDCRKLPEFQTKRGHGRKLASN
ncbi:hypothetical protein SNE40_014409 [Patella caerulea]|uniref:Uncharacterized protein n=1 Tax=Patella caerulea TaxID=87958 RepID=A0AAN8JL27_PATCE